MKKTVYGKRSFFIAFFVRKKRESVTGNDKKYPLSYVIYIVTKIERG